MTWGSGLSTSLGISRTRASLKDPESDIQEALGTSPGCRRAKGPGTGWETSLPTSRPPLGGSCLMVPEGEEPNGPITSERRLEPEHISPGPVFSRRHHLDLQGRVQASLSPALSVAQLPVGPRQTQG